MELTYFAQFSREYDNDCIIGYGDASLIKSEIGDDDMILHCFNRDKIEKYLEMSDIDSNDIARLEIYHHGFMSTYIYFIHEKEQMGVPVFTLRFTSETIADLRRDFPNSEIGGIVSAIFKELKEKFSLYMNLDEIFGGEQKYKE